MIINTVGDILVAFFAIVSILFISGWVFQTLYNIGGRNEFEELQDSQEEFEQLRKDFFRLG